MTNLAPAQQRPSQVLWIEKGDRRFPDRFHLGNYPQVLADIKKATRINPEWNALINRASPEEITNCSDIEFRNSVVDLADDLLNSNPKYLAGLGVIQFRSSQFELARDSLNEAIKNTKNSDAAAAYHHYFLAMNQYELGNCDDARKSLTTANQTQNHRRQRTWRVIEN